MSDRTDAIRLAAWGAVRSGRLSPNGALVLLALAERQARKVAPDRHGHLSGWVGADDVSDLIPLARSTVARWLRDLETGGWIAKSSSSGTGGRAAMYRLEEA